jgi:hypothetical protein
MITRIKSIKISIFWLLPVPCSHPVNWHLDLNVFAVVPEAQPFLLPRFLLGRDEAARMQRNWKQFNKRFYKIW